MALFNSFLPSEETAQAAQGDVMKRLDFQGHGQDSLYNLTLYDPSHIFHGHQAPFLGPSAGHLTIAQVLDMSSDSLFSELDDVSELLSAPIIEIEDTDPIPFPATAVANGLVHPVSPCMSTHEPREASRVNEENGPRFREYQDLQWHKMYQELLEYKQVKGDTLVPHRYAVNPPLGRWVKVSFLKPGKGFYILG